MNRMNADELAVRQHLKDDFEHYAGRCLKIRTKGGAVAALEINEAQRYIHDRLEQQLRETGKIRALILKGRQQGCSTYVEGRFYHKVTHRRGVRAFILTHMDEATSNLFEMVERFQEHVPALVRPRTSTANAKELAFDLLDSGYKVGTAGSKGAGRSSTIQYFHGSEVAYWPNAEKHVAGALQAVPNAPGTEIILESTSDGPAGLFYEMCRAAEAGNGEYQLIFVPWFWQPEYRLRVPKGFEPTEEEREYSALCKGLDLEQLAWRRSKIVELRGVENFRREYPANVHEAFTADAKGALWKREQIKRNRIHLEEMPEFDLIVVGIDPMASEGADGAETGIVVAGRGQWLEGNEYKPHAFILEDASVHASPRGWAQRAVKAAKDWLADRLVAEKNNGGDMVETVLLTVDEAKEFRIVLVWASRGKVTRAEPIAALYENDKVHHVGEHPALEDQQCTWKPGDKSPNRIDALVWAVWALMIDDGLDEETAKAGGEVAPEEGNHLTDAWEY